MRGGLLVLAFGAGICDFREPGFRFTKSVTGVRARPTRSDVPH